jgi:hypothetical protein
VTRKTQRDEEKKCRGSGKIGKRTSPKIPEDSMINKMGVETEEEIEGMNNDEEETPENAR